MFTLTENEAGKLRDFIFYTEGTVRGLLGAIPNLPQHDTARNVLATLLRNVEEIKDAFS